MRWRPEGLMPTKVGRQEAHEDEQGPEEGGPPDAPNAATAEGGA
jgi:hypothetical protein